MPINKPENVRVICSWGKGSHIIAETVKAGAPADIPGMYLPADQREMLESWDNGKTWEVMTGDVFPLVEV